MEVDYHDAVASFAEPALIEGNEKFSRFSDPRAFCYPIRCDPAQALLASGMAYWPLNEASGAPKARLRDPV